MNMKQSCKALICAIEGELDGRHCTEEQAAAILDHALPSLTEALALAEAERDRYKVAWMEFMDRTDWMQEKGQVPAKYLGQHRADVLTAMLNEARAALATQPADGEPVAHRLVGVQVNGEWKEIKGKWVDGAPIAEMVEGVEEGWCRVELAFSAPPAAAHGDEMDRDEAQIQCLRDLYESGYNDGQNNPNGYSSISQREDAAQHTLRDMRAQAGEGGEV